MPVVQVPQDPPCKPDAPAAFVHNREGVVASAGRLVVHVTAADTLQRRPVMAIVLFRQSDRSGGAKTDTTGTVHLDSLTAGSLILDVRPLGFNRLLDTLQVRSGFVDTIVVGLATACK